jgi:UDPglucose 6-dehydrogenase
MAENLVMKNIGIIGSGVVGSATGKGFHRLGHDVLFYDISKQRVCDLKESGYKITSNVQDIIKADISFVCVNTPTRDNGEQDLSQLMSVLYDITKNSDKKKNNNGILILLFSEVLCFLEP